MKNTTRAGIYEGWVGFQNLGDEVMYQICKERFAQIRWASYGQLSYTPSAERLLGRAEGTGPRWLQVLRQEMQNPVRLRKLATQGQHLLARVSGGQVGVLGGGTLINRDSSNLAKYLALRKRTKRLVPVFGTGVASPEFWTGRPGWRDKRKEWVEALEELPVVGVRGPRSLRLLEEAGAKNVVISGDPAIACHVRYQNVAAWQRPDRPMRVGINTGDCSGNLWGNADGIHDALVALARWLRTEDHEVELLPVWRKDSAANRLVAREAGMVASSVSEPLLSREQYLNKVETFDVVVAVKLHAAVLAAAANIPCVVLAYQPKCQDFAESIGWERFLIRTDQLSPIKLIDRVAMLMEELPAARAELVLQVGQLARQFEHYCHSIEPMILGSRSQV